MKRASDELKAMLGVSQVRSHGACTRRDGAETNAVCMRACGPGARTQEPDSVAQEMVEHRLADHKTAAPFSYEQVAWFDAANREAMLGDRIHALVSLLPVPNPGKVTGMILQGLTPMELFDMLMPTDTAHGAATLVGLVKEAGDVLAAQELEYTTTTFVSSSVATINQVFCCALLATMDACLSALSQARRRFALLTSLAICTSAFYARPAAALALCAGAFTTTTITTATILPPCPVLPAR